ncbi:hypothetical protein [Ferrimonas marina]|uniref:Uncharacterized protein n=1 Tax=Ferrimonas marina TaxID=299255 RepID=A0A1M5TWK0_9GAMM|nr:hypothetical protein [Ferrimonas marina]SHH55099.1 hypothetical protein SAMN02745129_2305 [Ferrimonas marina]
MESINNWQQLSEALDLDNRGNALAYVEFVPLHASGNYGVHLNDLGEAERAALCANAPGIAAQSVCRNDPDVTFGETLNFPFERGDFMKLVTRLLWQQIADWLREAYSIHDQAALDFCCSFFNDDKLLEKALARKDFEVLVEDIDGCHYHPYYDDGEWLQNWVGIGFAYDGDEDCLSIVFSDFDGSDWDNDRYPLPEEWAYVQNKIRALEQPTDLTEYYQWVLEHGEDPLDQGPAVRGWCDIAVEVCCEAEGTFRVESVQAAWRNPELPALTAESLLVFWSTEEFEWREGQVVPTKLGVENLTSVGMKPGELRSFDLAGLESLPGDLYQQRLKAWAQEQLS